MASVHATAALLSIGDELTLGQGLDTNSQWLSQRLVELGILCVEHATVADDLSAIQGAILRLAGRADVVISTGGLGPTADDLTREALARAIGESLVEDPAALGGLRRWFAGRARPMPEANRMQALRPVSATMLANEFGTAPGLGATVGGKEIFCLPGPPREMRPMFDSQVRPRLRPAREVRTRALHTFGLGESEVAERLGDLMARTRMPIVGTTVASGVVTIRIRSEGSANGAPAPSLEETERLARDRVAPYAFGTDSDTLASTVIALLKSRAQKVAVVESCTGGLLGTMITEVPGSRAVFAGGWITYSNQMKMQQIGVPSETLDRFGAVSRQCAEAMARGGAEHSGADWAVAVTGIAGPAGGTPEKPVGTVWIAIAGPHPPEPGVWSTEARRFLLPGERQNVRDWSARSALAMLRFRLDGIDGVPLLRQVE